MFKTFQNRFLLIWLLGIMIYVPLMEGFNAWFDEQFSLYLTSLSWGDMFRVNITEDGHPPLHYILLRLWNYGRDFHDVGWARLLSLFLLAMTALLGAFPVRRLMGDKIALWFTAFIFLFPRNILLGTDMRMYGLLNLEITAMVIYALLALQDGKISDWIKFLVASICALYTHYFGALSLAVLDSFLFFAILKQKKCLKKQLFFLFTCASISALTFLPWFILVFLKQASQMYADWYPDLNSLYNAYYTFLFPFHMSLNPVSTIIVAIFSSLMWILLFQAITDKKTKNYTTILSVVSLYLGVFFIAIIFSLTVRPMMSWRYLTQYAGSLALAMGTIIAHETRFKKIFLLLLGGTFISLYMARLDVLYDSIYRDIQSNIRKMVPVDDTVFLCREDQQMMTMFFYLPEYTRYYVPAEKRLDVPSQILKPIPEDKMNLTGKRVYLFYPYIPNQGWTCQTPVTNNYDHHGAWCLLSLAPEEATYIIEKSKPYWRSHQ